LVARELNKRHEGRSTLQITDEYDVQDLSHGLLRLYFEDIRREQWTPELAGSSARIDFLLQKELIAIEVKMARKGLSKKAIGDQLIIDIAHSETPKLQNSILFYLRPRRNNFKSKSGKRFEWKTW